MTHTIETVKEILPKVQVKVGKKVMVANVSGRRNRFATVWTKDNMDGWKFSWQTIVNSLNDNKPLSV